MIRQPPISTRTYTLVPYTTLFRSLTTARVPQTITEAILSAGLQPWSFLIVVNLLLLLGGQFMEPSGLLLIVAPVVFPIAMELGIDPIHLGVIMVDRKSTRLNSSH